jgi:hypothetical protein
MRIRIGFIAVLACLALAMVGAPAAGAATSSVPRATDAGPLLKMPIKGVAKNGKQFKGTYGIYKFVVKNGKVWSVGTLKGKLKGRHVTRGNVMMPASVNDGSAAQAAVTCTVLHLVLGPINLNLLGLHVTLGGGLQANQPIVLDITAEQGGGLLGDLLCGLTNALGGTGGLLGQLTGQLQQLATTLNSIIALLGGL